MLDQSLFGRQSATGPGVVSLKGLRPVEGSSDTSADLTPDRVASRQPLGEGGTGSEAGAPRRR